MRYDLKRISSATIKGRRVIVRADLDVVKDGKIKDDERLIRALPTLRYLLDKGASRIVIIAHNGKPKGEADASLSLRPVAKWLSKRLRRAVDFQTDYLNRPINSRSKIVLLENLRFHNAEKSNDTTFAKQLAQHADIYINDAFATSHRKHASMHAIARYLPSDAGKAVQQEVTMLSKVTDRPARPLHVIVGFAKITDKLQVLEKLMTKADLVFVGGGIMFTFLKAKGYDVGSSLVDDQGVPVAERLLNRYRNKIVLPEDTVIARSLDAPKSAKIVPVDRIPDGWMGLDIGPATIESYAKRLDAAKTVFWNGPVGVFEVPPFDKASNELARHLASSTAKVIIGGGDTTDAVKHAGVADRLAHVSTGGGASLSFIQGARMPGLVVVSRKP